MRRGTPMNEHSPTTTAQTTTKDGAEQSVLAIEQAAPPPRPSPMPTQVIEFWTPRLLLVALLYWVGSALRRAAHGATVSAADSHEPR
jgi:hypothetical protein